ncbi:TRAP transporter small permease subunit [Jannaschia sp. CCS1]|uniref:TRAP transporter small permease subunit n=1 Tax=Jannaschia sp. (strain CCS1) TaxID=290400 RepID=UPI0002F75523|nr:TRAP transporter small permease subunit [Jannaschia sp. CCS1]
MKLGDRAVTALAFALLVLMLAIVAQVLFSALDVNPVARFGTDLPLLGDAITLNSLLDFQWHLLVITGLVPAGLVWLLDRHVRVDFIYQARSTRAKARIDLLGNLVFAVPFLALAIPAAIDVLRRAWRSDEGSRNGGLNDLWLIKAVLPLGLTLLALAIALETIRLIRSAR